MFSFYLGKIKIISLFCLLFSFNNAFNQMTDGSGFLEGYEAMLRSMTTNPEEEERMAESFDFARGIPEIFGGQVDMGRAIEFLNKHSDKVEKSLEFVAELGAKAASAAKDIFESKKNSLNRDLLDIGRQLDRLPENSAMRDILENKKKRIEMELYNIEKNGQEISNHIIDLTAGNLVDASKKWLGNKLDEKDREQERQYDVLKAKVKMKELMNALTSKETFTRGGITAVLTLTGIISSYYLGKLGFNYLDSKIGKPVLVKESSINGFKESLKNVFGIKKARSVFSVDDVILEPKTKNILLNFANEVESSYENGLPFRNALFYGLPGTGKTMFAKAMANACGLDYAIMSGADFSQFANGEDIVELHKLFDWAESSKKGLLVFIDEADSFLRDRRVLSNAEKNLLNVFLSRTGTDNKKLLFVFATNYENELDPAVLSRIHKKIEFQLPSFDERLSILNMYFEKYILQDKRTIKKDGKSVDFFIEVSEDLDTEFINDIARKIDGFSGRDMEQLVSEFRVAAYSSGEGVISKEIINNALEQKIKEHEHDMFISRIQSERYKKELGL